VVAQRAARKAARPYGGRGRLRRPRL